MATPPCIKSTIRCAFRLQSPGNALHAFSQRSSVETLRAFSTSMVTSFVLSVNHQPATFSVHSIYHIAWWRTFVHRVICRLMTPFVHLVYFRLVTPFVQLDHFSLVKPFVRLVLVALVTPFVHLDHFALVSPSVYLVYVGLVTPFVHSVNYRLVTHFYYLAKSVQCQEKNLEGNLCQMLTLSNALYH